MRKKGREDRQVGKEGKGRKEAAGGRKEEGNKEKGGSGSCRGNEIKMRDGINARSKRKETSKKTGSQGWKEKDKERRKEGNG